MRDKNWYESCNIVSNDYISLLMKIKWQFFIISAQEMLFGVIYVSCDISIVEYV